MPNASGSASFPDLVWLADGLTLAVVRTTGRPCSGARYLTGVGIVGGTGLNAVS
jgi:hypothetical protein